MSSNGNTIPPYVFEQKGTFGAPFTFDVPGSLEVRPDTATARFDGTNASGPFLACLTFYGTDGERLGRWFNPTVLQKGDVAEVTYTPPFGSAATSAATGGAVETTNTGGTVTVNPTTELLIGTNLVLTSPTTGVAKIAVAPNSGALTLDIVQITTPVFVTHGSAAQDLVIQGNPLTYDGSTQVLLEFFTPQLDIQTGGNIIIELWRASTDLARWAQVDIDPTANDIGHPAYLSAYLTPPAGTYAFAVKGWTTSGAPFVQAGPGSGGPNTFFMPAYFRISKTNF